MYIPLVRDDYIFSLAQQTNLTIPHHQSTYIGTGEYTFLARAKNSSNVISEKAEFRFTIQTPFYQTIFAYIVYLIIGISLIYLFVIWRIYSVKKSKQKT